jgi:hypothetical protein
VIQALPAFRGDPAAVDIDSALQIEEMPEWNQVDARDWHGIGFAQSVRLACVQGGGSLVPAGRGSGFRLSGIFWRSLVRGGHQGAVYVLDSAREAARRGLLKKFLSG